MWRKVEFWPFPLTCFVAFKILSHYRANVWCEMPKVCQGIHKCHNYHAILHKLYTWFGKNELRLYLNRAKISSIGEAAAPAPPSKCALVSNPKRLLISWKLVGNPGCQPGFPTSFQLVRLVEFGLYGWLNLITLPSHGTVTAHAPSRDLSSGAKMIIIFESLTPILYYFIFTFIIYLFIHFVTFRGAFDVFCVKIRSGV